MLAAGGPLMTTSSTDSKLPALVAYGLIAAGLVLALATGITRGSIAGGIIAALAVIPACYGMWKGLQQETQTSLALSVLAVLAALGVGGILIVLRVVDWIR
jgi:hypothetical protein